MFKQLQSRTSAIFTFTIMALVLLSGCSDSNVAKHNISLDGVMKEQHDNQMNKGMQIEKKLDAIVHDTRANQLSSNPYDYIKGSKEYEDILLLGDDALRYMLKSLEISQEDGLKEYIMAEACSSMLAEDPEDKKWSTGKGWYEGYISKRSEVRSGGSNQENIDFDHIYGRFAYPPTWPKVEILHENHRIYWDRGDANFTGEAGGVIGNTNFGMNEEWVDVLKPNIIRPESKLVFKAAEVPGLDTPRFTLQMLNQDEIAYHTYPSQQNTMLVPKKEGEYIFILTVNWGNGDNSILYWFKLEVKQK